MRQALLQFEVKGLMFDVDGLKFKNHFFKHQTSDVKLYFNLAATSLVMSWAWPMTTEPERTT